VADAVDHVDRTLSGRSQMLWMAGAAGRACVDLVMRRSSRAARLVASQHSAGYAQACVEEWMRSAAAAAKERAPYDAPFAVPLLLTGMQTAVVGRQDHRAVRRQAIAGGAATRN
jgi:hypothetical protein